MEGIFSGWVGKGSVFGFITPDGGANKMFVHRSEVLGVEGLGKNARVSFEVVTTPKGPKAINICVLSAATAASSFVQGQGFVKFWKHEAGFGFISPDNGRDDVFVHVSALPASQGGYLSEGDIVKFEAEVTAGENRPRATRATVIGWSAPQDELMATVDMGHPSWPEVLAGTDKAVGLAEREPWEYKLSPNPESYPILRSYIRYTFRRLREMDGGVLVARHGRRAAFNTGLVTPNQEEIFGVLAKNDKPNRQEWKLAGFKKASDRDMVENFGDALPPLADYFDDPAVLLYDRRCQLIINIDHVLENLNRFPKALQENVFMTRQLLEGAQATMRKRVYRNYKTAIPQYYRDKGREGSVQLLLPICLTNPAQADLALVVEKNREENAYLGSTVLTLDMAYNNARLLSRPDTEWLQP